jgi:hypothetical protein
VRAPDAAWTRLQRGVSGALGLLPPTVGHLACLLAGLDTDLAPLVDGRATSYAVFAERPGSDPAWVIALPLRDDSRAAAILLAGDVARYTARTEGGLRVLSRVSTPLDVGVALARGWLLLGRDDRAVLELGPYAYRTMPAEPAPSPGAFAVAVAPQSALAGPVAGGLLSRWNDAKAWLAARDEEQRAKHGGRAPDFGDPRAILDALDGVVRRRVDLLARAQAARLEVEVGDAEVSADLRVTPPPPEEGGSAPLLASLRPGDVRPLGAAPADALLALLVRDDPAERAEGARDVGAALEAALGQRLHGDDARAIHTALDDWARGRGDWLSAALAWGRSRGVWVRTPAAGGDLARRAVRELVGLLQRPAVGEPVGRALSLGPASIGPVNVANFDSATLASFGPLTAKAQPPAPPSFGVAWGVRDEDLFVAAGEGAARLLSAEASPEAKLADDPAVARAFSALRSDAAVVLVAQPLRFDPLHAEAGSAPAVFAVGRREADLWAHLEVADLLLRELVRLGAGL